ncbi:MAG TPA: hypothetical protein DCM45_06165 [Clostridiales bacterium]|nr:hypothetical protein [Clostridiales bacterium]
MTDHCWKIGLFRAAAIIVSLLMCLSLLASCAGGIGQEFPPLTTTSPDNTGLEPTTGTGSETSEPELQLTVAMPLDQEGLEALRLLFLARQSGPIKQEPGQYIGLQVLPDDLRQFDNGMTLTLLPVPAATGASTEQIELWRGSGSLPDIIYSRSAAEMVGLADCLDLTGFLYSNELLNANRISIPALENCRKGQQLFSIPYLASFPVIYLNDSLMMQLQLNMPARDWNWQEWRAFADQAQQAITLAGLAATPETISSLANDEEALNELLIKAIFVTDDLSSLMPWLPAAFDPSAGWAMWDGQQFDFESEALDNAVQWLSEDYLLGHSTLHLDENQRLKAFNAIDAIRSGRVLMWAGDSADIDSWRQAGLQVKACLMPIGLEEANGRLPISVRSLSVNTNSHLPELAASLAAFIALDADALLLQSRYKLYSGLSPLINDPMVQQTLLAGQADWSWLLQFTNQLMNASCSGQQVNQGWDRAVAASLGDYGPALLQAADRKERLTVIKDMIKAAQLILQEN